MVFYYAETRALSVYSIMCCRLRNDYIQRLNKLQDEYLGKNNVKKRAKSACQNLTLAGYTVGIKIHALSFSLCFISAACFSAFIAVPTTTDSENIFLYLFVYFFQLCNCIAMHTKQKTYFLTIAYCTEPSKHMRVLQQDLDLLHEWAVKWQLRLNVTKRTIMHFTRTFSPIIFNYKLKGNQA